MSNDKDIWILDGYRAMDNSQLENEKTRLIEEVKKLQKTITDINEKARSEKADFIRKKNAADKLLSLLSLVNTEKNTGKAPVKVTHTQQDIEDLLSASPDFKPKAKKSAK